MMPTFSNSGAMSLLWEKASSKLHAHELEWFAKGAVDQIKSDTDALSDVLMDLGCVISSEDGGSGSFADASSVSNLMFNLSTQISNLRGLAEIAVNAAYMARLARGDQS